MKFNSGNVVATPKALDAFFAAKEFTGTYLTRHFSGDWGDLGDEDKAENERALVEGFRLMSSYTLSTGVRIWIITEWDQSVTTILLPEEY